MPDKRLAGFIQHWHHRQVLRVEQRVIFHLPVVLIDLLLEITLTIEKADADKTNIQITGRFRVVTRQNAEATGGNRQRFVKAKFGGKISDRIVDE